MIMILLKAIGIGSFFSLKKEVIYMVKINGKELSCAGISLSDYLAGTDYDMKRIAVECNGEIVPKAQYDNKILADGDSIEIVSFVGGG